MSYDQKKIEAGQIWYIVYVISGSHTKSFILITYNNKTNKYEAVGLDNFRVLTWDEESLFDLLNKGKSPVWGVIVNQTICVSDLTGIEDDLCKEIKIRGVSTDSGES